MWSPSIHCWAFSPNRTSRSLLHSCESSLTRAASGGSRNRAFLIKLIFLKNILIFNKPDRDTSSFECDAEMAQTQVARAHAWADRRVGTSAWSGRPRPCPWSCARAVDLILIFKKYLIKFQCTLQKLNQHVKQWPQIVVASHLAIVVRIHRRIAHRAAETSDGARLSHYFKFFLNIISI